MEINGLTYEYAVMHILFYCSQRAWARLQRRIGDTTFHRYKKRMQKKENDNEKRIQHCREA